MADTNKSPKVSVILPTYRRPDLLERALASVLSQTFTDFEVLVIDDNGLGSEEQHHTKAMLASKFDDDRIRYLANETGQGGAEARNIGIRSAQSSLIAFLDDDEDWLPEKLERQVQIMDRCDEDVGVIDTGFYDWKSSGECRTVLPKMQGWILEQLLRKTGGRAPKLSTMLCRKSALIKSGLFDSELKARQDYDLYIRLARDYQFDSVLEPLANKRADAADRITSSPHNFAQGFEVVYSKVKQDLLSRPRTHAIYLLKYSEVLAKAGRKKEAFGLYWKAFKLSPLNPRLIVYGLRIIAS